jgi:uncharacterized protein
MRDEIEGALTQIEADCRVRILYACESGSRAWGFASPDSDYDVRFIYLHELDWYLDIADHRDVIERMLPGDLDVSGWELRKALRLFQKSNPPLLEWLSSPIVYREDAKFTSGLGSLMHEYYSPTSCFGHYLHMAEGNVRGYLQADVVRTKKYLYVLRPILGCRWIEQDRGPVPMEFEKLYVTLEDEATLTAIKNLVDRKKAGGELEEGKRDPVIGDFIEVELPRLRAIVHAKQHPPEIDNLNRFFRSNLVKADFELT